MKHPTKAELEAALARHPSIDRPSFAGRKNDLDTGILVPILGGDELRALLTERPKTMRNHGGEVSFPGGKPEPGDRDLLATALRETHEEIGLRTVDVLGKLSSVPLATSAHRIHPYVGWADERELAPNPDEVARLVVFSLPELYSRTSIDAIPWTDERGEDLVPVFETGGRMLFGATAFVLYELLIALAPAFEATVPARVSGRFTWDDALRVHD